MTNSWNFFLTIYITLMLQLIDFLLITPLGGMLASNQLIDSATISYSVTLYSVSAILGSLIIAKLSSKEINLIVSILLTILAISNLILFLHQSNMAFLLSKLLSGLGGGIVAPIAYSQISNIKQISTPGQWNGRLQTTQSIAIVFGVPVLIILAEKASYRATYGTLALLFFLMAIYIFSTKKFVNNLKPKNENLSIYKDIKLHLYIPITAYLAFLASFLFIIQFPNYLLNTLYVSPKTLAFSYTVCGLLTFLFSGNIGKLGDRENYKNLFALSCILLVLLQFMLLFIKSGTIACLIFFPLYILFSNARAIFQRNLIIKLGKGSDVTNLHLLNNVFIRFGILSSGLVIGALSIVIPKLSLVFKASNILSILVSITLILFLLSPIMRQYVKKN